MEGFLEPGCEAVRADAENAAIGLGAGEEIAFGVEAENFDVGLVAGVIEVAFALGSYGVNLAFVSGGDIESAIRAEGEVPNVFGFGFEEDAFLAGRGNFVDLAVGRGADVERALGIESDALREEIGGFEYGFGLSTSCRSETLLRGSRHRHIKRQKDRYGATRDRRRPRRRPG